MAIAILRTAIYPATCSLYPELVVPQVQRFQNINTSDKCVLKVLERAGQSVGFSVDSSIPTEAVRERVPNSSFSHNVPISRRAKRDDEQIRGETSRAILVRKRLLLLANTETSNYVVTISQVTPLSCPIPLTVVINNGAADVFVKVELKSHYPTAADHCTSAWISTIQIFLNTLVVIFGPRMVLTLRAKALNTQATTVDHISVMRFNTRKSTSLTTSSKDKIPAFKLYQNAFGFMWIASLIQHGGVGLSGPEVGRRDSDVTMVFALKVEKLLPKLVFGKACHHERIIRCNERHPFIPKGFQIFVIAGAKVRVKP
ncbi:hypothetical protein BJ138DRAFT_1105084 [Hygrophoropsis aurantiaca]|uniref:Uncharacterized protein n=1 Tax=Hygrophoropsis aurantiaca TaxID=72124 RepID=A0ACB7ZZ23_9AGAM|nr:hypothetical protein BJ138DRAFT_1105084 [Hygrophoropsis aurantiaca]